MTQNTLIDKYKEKVLSILKIKFPGLNIVKFGKYLDKVIDEKITDKKVFIENQYENILREGSLNKLINSMIFNKVNPIIAGNGMLFKNQDVKKSFSTEMIDYLLEERSVTKKLKFKYINIDKELSRRYHIEQNVFKVLANSIFGIYGESNSYFYERNIAEAITYTGAILSTTSILAFEEFLGNNFIFNTIDEVYKYVEAIVNEENIDLSKIDKYIEKHISIKKLSKYLYQKLRNPKLSDLQEITDFISSLDQNQLDRIYYKNNLIKFFKNSSKLQKKFKDAIESKDTTVSQENINDIWNILKTYVVLINFKFDRYERCEKDLRKVVILCDTDSNFICLDTYYRLIIKEFSIEDTDENIVKVVGIVAAVLTKFIEAVFQLLCRNMNILERFIPRIRMKNEYLMSRVMLTQNKRNYAARNLSIEGNLLDNPEIDIKGLAIKKITTIKRVRVKFLEILKYILSTKELDLSVVIQKFMLLEKDIEESLNSLNTEYLLPANLKDKSGYKFPYRIEAYRGMLAWNVLNPTAVLHAPEKINLIHIKTRNIPEEVQNCKQYKAILELINSDKDLAHFGFNVLSVPKGLEIIPDWIRPIIDIQSMVLRHLSNGLLLLESCNINVIKLTNSKSVYSNIIKLA